MNTRRDTQTEPSRPATPEDVRHVLGDVEDVVVAEILSTRPTLRDLSEAAIWVRGNSDLAVREHKELSTGALAVAEILLREEEELVDNRDQT
jgi:hypothetical protein